MFDNCSLVSIIYTDTRKLPKTDSRFRVGARRLIFNAQLLTPFSWFQVHRQSFARRLIFNAQLLTPCRVFSLGGIVLLPRSSCSYCKKINLAHMTKPRHRLLQSGVNVITSSDLHRIAGTGIWLYTDTVQGMRYASRCVVVPIMPIASEACQPLVHCTGYQRAGLGPYRGPYNGESVIDATFQAVV